MDTDIIPVRSPQQLKRFIKCPWQVYGNDPYWVPELISEQKKHLDPDHNPFFEHAEAEYFVALQDGRPVGRIAATVDHNFIAFHEEPVGFFGFFECIPQYEVAEGLLQHAVDWLKGHQLEIMRGPMSFSTNDQCAMLVEGFDAPPALMMPYNPTYYPEYMERFGCRKARDLLAYLFTAEQETPPKLVRVAETVRRRQRITVRPIDLKRLDDELPLLEDVYNRAWEENWSFVPMTSNELHYMAKQLKQIADPALALFAEVDGHPVGFILGLPDFNQALKRANGRLFPTGLIKLLIASRKIDGIRVLLFGVVDEYRRKGIDALLLLEIFRAGREKGYQWAELSWILEDNVMMNRIMENFGASVYKRYRIYDYPMVSKDGEEGDHGTERMG